MKYVGIFFLILFFSCSSKVGSYLKTEDLIPHIEYEYAYTDKYSPKYRKFYKINIEQAKKTRWPILYEGTVEHYHLFRLAPKGPIKTDEVLTFAINRENCIITDEKNPDVEDKNQREKDNLRWAEIRGNKLIVEENFNSY